MTHDLPFPLNELPFSVDDARRAGLPPSRLRQVDLEAPFRGVRVPGGLETSLVDKYLPLLRQGHVLSHGTAAVLWGMWLPYRVEVDPLVDVLAVGSARPVRMRGVRGHHVDQGRVQLQMCEGIPATSPAETLRMISPLLNLGELVAAGDSLIRREGALVEWVDLERCARRHYGQRGAKKLTAALTLMRSGCDSPMETRVRLILNAFGLPDPQVNPVVSRLGEPVRYGDMVYVRWRVIVEYDGEHHRTGAQYGADIERLEQLARAGWTVVRVLKEHLDHPERVASRVRTALWENGWRA